VNAIKAQVRRWVVRGWEIAGAFSVRTKILGIVLSLMVLLGLGVTVQVRSLLVRTLRDRLQEQSVSIARDVAARATDLILINDLYSLHQLLQDTLANNTDVRYVFILDADGYPIAHTFEGGFPLDLIDANPCQGCRRQRSVVLETDEGPIWDTAVPVLEGKAGVARVGLTEASLEQTLMVITTQLLLTTLAVTVVGIVAGGFLTWILTRPILALVDATRAVANGDLTRRVARWADDEIGALAEAFNHMTAELAQAEQARAERDRLRAKLLDNVISAQEEERKRIARELHDETGQALTSLLIGLRTLEERCPSQEVKDQAEELRSVTTETLESVHNLALELRPSVLDDLGLVAAVERYVAEFAQRYSLQVDMATHGMQSRRFAPSMETALYRIVQEGLTNVARHAQARTVSLLLECRANWMRVILEDDGRGFDLESVLHSTRRLGLYGMQERVEILGGTLAIESRPGAGTSIFVEVPLQQEAVLERAMDGGRTNAVPEEANGHG
jgi:signal transduction histidine kinase